jgi:3-phosphoshikimate 1-carboxyvinyltransferase
MVPGDKSISHRAAMIAALAEGSSRITNFSTSEDCAATLACLAQLGVSIERDGGGLLIHGVGLNGLTAPAAPLDCRNSGTTMRLLAGILAAQNFETKLTGDASLHLRPMQRIIEPLKMMGANISSHKGRAPLAIAGHRPLRAITYKLLVASAQVKSCVLLAGLNAEGRTEVIENEPTRDHTERMLRWFNVPIETGEAEREGEAAYFAAVSGPARFVAREVSIPGDISSAAYFIAAAALVPDSSIEIDNVGLNPTRTSFLNQLRALGFEASVTEVREQSNEPVGLVSTHGAEDPRPPADVQTPILIDGLAIAQLIDELPLLAVVGSQIEGGLEIRDATELRVKESDRIATTADGLRAMGVEVEEFDDGLRVAGPARLRGAEIDSRGDHRIAMAFSVAGLIAEGNTEIKGADCVAVSFPEFFGLLDSVVE